MTSPQYWASESQSNSSLNLSVVWTVFVQIFQKSQWYICVCLGVCVCVWRIYTLKQRWLPSTDIFCVPDKIWSREALVEKAQTLKTQASSNLWEYNFVGVHDDASDDSIKRNERIKTETSGWKLWSWQCPLPLYIYTIYKYLSYRRLLIQKARFANKSERALKLM
jgi:hypothetical protein